MRPSTLKYSQITYSLCLRIASRNSWEESKIRLLKKWDYKELSRRNLQIEDIPLTITSWLTECFPRDTISMGSPMSCLCTVLDTLMITDTTRSRHNWGISYGKKLGKIMRLSHLYTKRLSHLGKYSILYSNTIIESERLYLLSKKCGCFSLSLLLINRVMLSLKNSTSKYFVKKS